MTVPTTGKHLCAELFVSPRKEEGRMQVAAGHRKFENEETCCGEFCLLIDADSVPIPLPNNVCPNNKSERSCVCADTQTEQRSVIEPAIHVYGE